MPDDITIGQLKDAFEKHAKSDEAFQQKQLKVNLDASRSRAALHKRLNSIPTKEDTATIVEDVITKLLLQKGKWAFAATVSTSVFVVSIVALFGGLKTILGWIGIGLIHKP